ncbi:MAG: hemolysin III family protein [Butyrivibrio sp.]|nr:hemolysin III family protein [Butyrivibrio sp.]
MRRIRAVNNNGSASSVNDRPVSESRLKDPVSCLTHLWGCIAAVACAPLLIVHAARSGVGRGGMGAVVIFLLSMALLYGASAAYHGFKVEGRAGMVLKRLDHMMIFVLIAGTYTPVCVCAMGAQGRRLLTVIWLIAAAGILFKLFWVTCPKWVSSTIYIAMGWVVLFAMPKLMPVIRISTFVWLLAGGVIYTIGGVIYALKLVRFNARDSRWGSHEIFHLFVLAGSLCHFIAIYSIF